MGSDSFVILLCECAHIFPAPSPRTDPLAVPHLHIQKHNGIARLNLTDRSITIGRARENIVIMSHKHVSRQHCVIELHDETYQLRDLGSLSGTKVNGKPVTMVILADSDRIQIGPFELLFYDSEPTQDMPAPGDSQSHPTLEEPEPPTSADEDSSIQIIVDESGMMPALEEDDHDEPGAVAIETPPPKEPSLPKGTHPEDDPGTLKKLKAIHGKELAEHREKIKVLKQERDGFERANQEFSTRVDQLASDLAQHDELKREVDARIVKLTEQAETLSTQRDTLTESNELLEANQLELDSQIAARDEEITTLKAAEEKTRAEIAKERDKLQKLEKKLTARKNKIDKEDEKSTLRVAELDESKKQFAEREELHEAEMESRREDFEAKTDAATTQHQAEMARIELIEKELATQQESLETQAEALEKDRTHLTGQLEQMQAEWKQHEDRAAAIVDELLAEQRADLAKRELSLTSQYELIEKSQAEIKAREGELADELALLDKQRDLMESNRVDLEKDREKLQVEREEIDQLEQKTLRHRETVKADHTRVKEEFLELKKSQTEIDMERKEVEQAHEAIESRLEEGRAQIEAEFIEVRAEIESKQQDLVSREQTLTDELATIDAKHQALADEKSTFDEQQTQALAELQTESDRLEAQAKTITETEKALEARATFAAELQAQLTEQQTALSTQQETFARDKVEIQATADRFDFQRAEIIERQRIMDLDHEQMQQDIAEAESKMGQYHRQAEQALKTLEGKTERIAQLSAQLTEAKRSSDSSDFAKRDAIEKAGTAAREQSQLQTKITKLEVEVAQTVTLQNKVNLLQTSAANAGDLANQAFRVLNIMRGLVDKLHQSLDDHRIAQDQYDTLKASWIELNRMIAEAEVAGSPLLEELQCKRDGAKTALESLRSARNETEIAFHDSAQRIVALSLLRKTQLPQPPGAMGPMN